MGWGRAGRLPIPRRGQSLGYLPLMQREAPRRWARIGQERLRAARPTYPDSTVRAVLALGGSTNAIIHLIAIARRAGIGLDLDRFDALSRSTPVLADVQPGGRYLMEDFYYAGGLRGLLGGMSELLDLEARTVQGTTLGAAIAGAEVHDSSVIRGLDDPVSPEGALAVLRAASPPTAP